MQTSGEPLNNFWGITASALKICSDCQANICGHSWYKYKTNRVRNGGEKGEVVNVGQGGTGMMADGEKTGKVERGGIWGKGGAGSTRLRLSRKGMIEGNGTAQTR